MRSGARDQISAAELREANAGFVRLLRAKRFSPRFIEEHAEDLMGKALVEYAAWIDSGRAPYSPAGWLITAAWRRTQEFLDYNSRRPQSVSIEMTAEVADTEPEPEQLAIEHDRGELLRRAIAELEPRDQELLRLTFFEGLRKSEAARVLGCSGAHATRRTQASLEQLSRLLADRLEEIPAFEIGLAAWVALNVRQGWSLRLASAAEAIRELPFAIAERAVEPWKRIAPTLEPATAPVAGGAGRALGVCGVTVLACVVGAAVGVETGNPPERRTPPAKQRAAVPEPSRAAVAVTEAASPPGSRVQPGASERAAPRVLPKARPVPGEHRRETRIVGPRGDRTPAEQTTTEFELGGTPVTPGSPAPTPPPSPSGDAPQVSARPATGSAGPGPGPGSPASTEFGL